MNHSSPMRRMTLRQIVTHTDKCVRDCQEHIQVSQLEQISDVRDLSRPVRRRSQYPRMIAVQNAINRMMELQEETDGLIDQMLEFLNEIRDHARRELTNR